MRRTLTSGLAALALTACASTPPPDYLAAPDQHEPPACPSATHVSAVAVVKGDRAEAEQTARASLARTLRSTVEVELNRVVEVEEGGAGAPKVDKKLKQAIWEQASFEHGELIRTAEVFPGEEKTYALVCLERARAIDAIQADNQEALEVFRAASDQALAALEGGNARAFTKAYREAVGKAPRAFKTLALLSALRGGPSEQEAALRQRWGAVLRGATTLKSATEIRLAWSGQGFEAHQGDVLERFRAALSSTGVPVAIDTAATCDVAYRYRVEVSGDANCRWGAAGHMCKPVFSARGQACGDSPRSIFDLQIEPEAGMHPREQARALSAALRSLDEEDLEPMTRVLREELPAEEDL